MTRPASRATDAAAPPATRAARSIYPRVMRQCPKCRVDFHAVKRTFAEVDVCPQCAGVFLDPGEGVATHGASSEASFLVRDGRAHLVRSSPYACPSGAHEPTTMQVCAVGFGPSAIEIDYCPKCSGFFLDEGEGAALDALDASEDEGRTTTTASGARFSAPPVVDRQSAAIDQARGEEGRSLFEMFAGDLLRSASEGARMVGDAGDAARRDALHRRRRRWGY